MVKSELVQLIAEQNPHLRQRDVEQAINTVFGEIIHALSLGDRVELRGFGAFSVREHEAKIGRNPHNGNAVEVAAKRVPHFKTGKNLHVKLNASQGPQSMLLTDGLQVIGHGAAKLAAQGAVSE